MNSQLLQRLEERVKAQGWYHVARLDWGSSWAIKAVRKHAHGFAEYNQSGSVTLTPELAMRLEVWFKEQYDNGSELG